MNIRAETEETGGGWFLGVHQRKLCARRKQGPMRSTWLLLLVTQVAPVPRKACLRGPGHGAPMLRNGAGGHCLLRAALLAACQGPVPHISWPYFLAAWPAASCCGASLFREPLLGHPSPG